MLGIPGWSGRWIKTQERREGEDMASAPLGSKVLQGSQGLILPCQVMRKHWLLPRLFEQLCS